MGDGSEFYGWRAVAAAFVIAAFGWGVGFYGPPVYLEAVLQAHDWPLGLVSGAITLHFLSGVFVIANLPALYRRFGLPIVTVAGAMILAIGITGWAIAQSPSQLYVAALLSGASWPTMGAAAINAIVAPWFVKKRSTALSIAYNGASIGGVIFAPLWSVLIKSVGFASASALIGVGMVAVVLLLAARVLSRSPQNMGQMPDGLAAMTIPSIVACTVSTAPQRLRDDRSFVTLALGMSLALFAQIGLIAQLVSILTPTLGSQGAGFAAGLSSAAAISGRFLIGWLMPVTMDRRRVVSASLSVQVVGCTALVVAGGGSVPLLLIGVVLIGLGIGNATSLPPLIAQAEFRQAEVARVVALIIAISQAGYAFAPAVFGLLREKGPDYSVFVLAGTVQLGSIIAYLAGRHSAAA